MEIQPHGITEPEGYDYPVYLQGAGAAAPTIAQGEKSIVITRTGVGAYKLSFNDSPGPTFLGGVPGFGDATPANVLGWSVCFGAYTKATSSTPASLVFTVGNAANAAADLAATSTLKLALQFKRAPTDL